MVGVCVGDYGAGYWTPWIDVEIAGGAIQAGGGACEDIRESFVHAVGWSLVGMVNGGTKKHLQETGGV